jgi:Serpin (serine protease inhibitor)
VAQGDARGENKTFASNDEPPYCKPSTKGRELQTCRMLRCHRRQRRPPPASDVQRLVSADNAFAVDIYAPALALAGATNNMILSPFSVSATLTMVYAGTAGPTASQPKTVLGLESSAASHPPSRPSHGKTRPMARTQERAALHRELGLGPARQTVRAELSVASLPWL